ncbi:NUDIX domain-containing protein [Nocardioides sp. TRM66260-LWL]|uniref:NUDIX domain-containing protein n=1 Tax=Nocardioides sp. TRM66260-LWL TaxID=2874478 RepID=UPI001CC754EC|nr:NUDIX domain-containing protein [Nocardioides sp. TRM66260-LWL]MBZ5734630.1 NUDIX domain-containing protein [Nocardioides sp. TRM66260-LWL]
MIEGRYAIVPAAYVLLLRPGSGDAPEVLLQLRQNTGFMDGHWASAAAGHLEAGETGWDAARREAREELGIDDLDLAFATAMQRRRGEEAIEQRLDLFFTARAWTGEPRVVETRKAAEIRWVALDDLDALPGPVVPHERHVLERLHAGDLAPYETFGFDAAPEVERTGA